MRGRCGLWLKWRAVSTVVRFATHPLIPLHGRASSAVSHLLRRDRTQAPMTGAHETLTAVTDNNGRIASCTLEPSITNPIDFIRLCPRAAGNADACTSVPIVTVPEGKAALSCRGPHHPRLPPPLPCQQGSERRKRKKDVQASGAESASARLNVRCGYGIRHCNINVEA